MVTKMKLKHYMDYLKILHARYGDDIEVKVKVKDVYGDNEYKEEKCVPVFRPCYNKEFHCIVLHEFYVTHDY